MSDQIPVPDSLESAAVREMVERLNASAPEHSHFYSCLPEEAVDAFEKKHNITLPADYRYVITRLGNGIRHVLFPLGMEQMRGEGYTREYDDLGLVGDLSCPFPLTEAWNLPEDLLREPTPPPDATPEEEDRLSQKWMKELETAYRNANHSDGAIPIATRGCGQMMLLVVNGPQKGFVWNDSTAHGRGIFPLCDASGRPMTFANWFLSEMHRVVTRPSFVNPRRRTWGLGYYAFAAFKCLMLIVLSPLILIYALILVCFNRRIVAQMLRSILAVRRAQKSEAFRRLARYTNRPPTDG